MYDIGTITRPIANLSPEQIGLTLEEGQQLLREVRSRSFVARRTPMPRADDLAWIDRDPSSDAHPVHAYYGVSGAGKSKLLEKFRRDHAQADERGRRMIVAAELPPVPLLRSLMPNHPVEERRRLTDHAVARIGSHHHQHGSRTHRPE